MKRLLSLLLVLVLVFSVVACSQPEEKKEEPKQEEKKEEQKEEKKEEATKEEEQKEEPKKEEEKANVVEEAVNKYFAEYPEDMEKIKQGDFIQKVKDGEDMFIIDLRKAEDYAKGHVKGAVNFPWGPAVAENLKNVPQDKAVYMYCYSGQTAGQADAIYNMAGINAKSVNLGFNFGISKVEGVDEVLTEEAVEIKPMDNMIDPEIQKAADAYFGSLKDGKYPNYIIAEEKLKELVDAGDESIYILSIRSAEDFAKGHIKGATQMNFGKDMHKNFGTLPKDKTIIVYCYTGQTAGQTVAALRLLGFDAYSLKGGMGMKPNAPLGWSNKEFETVTE